MRRLTPVVVLSVAIMILGSCSSKPPQPPPPVTYEQAAITVKIKAAPMLNQYEGQPHTLLLYIYQLRDPNTFNSLRDDYAGLTRLLEGARFDASAVASKRIFVQPGDQLQVVLDRAEGAKFVGVVAGYYNVDKSSSTRLYEIPIIKETKGWIRKKTTVKFGKLVINLELGPEGIRG